MDQFYTKSHIAKYCFEKVHQLIDSEFDIYLEPSAGKGAFFKLMDPLKRIGLDLEPKYSGIQKMDFFDFQWNPAKKYAVIGNPPFGRVSSTAISFFNKASEFADMIAFIIPRTFKRTSVQNRLSLDFNLLFSEDLPLKPCCFSPEMSAKCCFQIWIKVSEKREKVILAKTHPHFTFLKLGEKDAKGQPTPPDGAHFAMKAYGSNCGEIVEKNLEKLRPKSWHWIVGNISLKKLKDRFQKLDYSISKDTVRQDSLGQQDLIELYTQKYS